MNCHVEVKYKVIPSPGPNDQLKADLLRGFSLLMGSKGVTPEYF